MPSWAKKILAGHNKWAGKYPAKQLAHHICQNYGNNDIRDDIRANTNGNAGNDRTQRQGCSDNKASDILDVLNFYVCTLAYV